MRRHCPCVWRTKSCQIIDPRPQEDCLSLLIARFKRHSNYRKDYAEFTEDMIAHCDEKALLNNFRTRLEMAR